MKARELEAQINKLKPLKHYGAAELLKACNTLGLRVSTLILGETFNEAADAKSLRVDMLFKLPQGHRDCIKVSVGASMAIRKLVGKPVVVNFSWSDK